MIGAGLKKPVEYVSGKYTGGREHWIVNYTGSQSCIGKYHLAFVDLT